MNSDKKLGRAINILYCTLVIIVFLGRLHTNPEHSHILTYIICFEALLLCSGLKHGEKRPGTIKKVIGLIYISLCWISLWVNESNNMVFLLIMLSIGLIALFFDTAMLKLYTAGNLIVAIIMMFMHFENVVNVFSTTDYLLNIVCICIEYLILANILKILYEREEAMEENNKTVDELLRVIDAKREDALAATKSKSSFLASMSHEIRTPINAVLGLNEMILRESNESNTKEYAMDIRSAGNSLLSLINDILDFSKIEAGKMELHPVSYDLSNLINDCMNIIAMRANDKGLSFNVTVDPVMPRILYGDEVRIKQIILNLLTNAVKYTEEGEVKLEFGYDKIGEYQIEMTVRVSDTGHGMKPEDVSRLFAPFERIEEVRNRHIEGTGLGMTLARNFLALMGSDIQVDTEYGRGSVFSFTIRQDVENWECVGALDEAIRRVKNSKEIDAAHFVAPKGRLLVVDDMPLNIKVFSSLLRRTGIRIDSAISGKEAMSMVRNTKYDIIFLDHMMPEMDGIQTLHNMKADRFNINRNDTPVIALTANAVSGAREIYISEGFEDYMTKPIDSAKLEALVIKYLDAGKVTVLDRGLDNDNGDKMLSGANDAEPVLKHLSEVDLIDVESGIQASGGIEIYENVIEDYAVTIDEYSNQIEDLLNKCDISNYTIQVHALKSSSRLLGAGALAELAAALERAGNENNLDFIRENNQKLLDMYRSLKEPLMSILEDKESDTDKQPIDIQMYREALYTIREAAECFDMDLIESVMNELDKYKLPDSDISAFKDLRVLLAQVDMEKTGELADRIISSLG